MKILGDGKHVLAPIFSFANHRIPPDAAQLLLKVLRVINDQLVPLRLRRQERKPGLGGNPFIRIGFL
jgi:hypothetical protein